MALDLIHNMKVSSIEDAIDLVTDNWPELVISVVNKDMMPNGFNELCALIKMKENIEHFVFESGMIGVKNLKENIKDTQDIYITKYAGKPTLVHCTCGVCRSPTVAAGLLSNIDENTIEKLEKETEFFEKTDPQPFMLSVMDMVNDTNLYDQVSEIKKQR